ncbi:MAG: hypothetical protein QXN55_09230 [Candidatus Nitrosotenuis sp.]
MSDLGVFTTKLFLNSNSLRQYNTSLRLLNKKVETSSRINENEISGLLFVLKPIVKKLSGLNSSTIGLNERALVDSLNQRHLTDWQQYKDRLVNITANLESNVPHVSKEDLSALEDVADALDVECANLFRSISGQL